MKVEAEEIFGPVVTVAPFKDLDERDADRERRRPTAWPPGSGPSDISKAHRARQRLRAGTVWINCYNVFDAALPFGGYKESGWGREMGHEVLELYTEIKAVCAQL